MVAGGARRATRRVCCVSPSPLVYTVRSRGSRTTCRTTTVHLRSTDTLIIDEHVGDTVPRLCWGPHSPFATIYLIIYLSIYPSCSPDGQPDPQPIQSAFSAATHFQRSLLCGDFICSAGHRLRARLSSKPGYRDRWHPGTHLIAPDSTDLTAALLRLR